MSNYTNPTGEDMDEMNAHNQLVRKDEQLISEARRMINPFDVYSPMPTRQHIRALLKRIDELDKLVNYMAEKVDISPV